MAKHKLRVGYVGTSIGSYYATEYGQRERAINGLRKLAEEWNFDLVAVAEEVMTEEAAQQAADRLQAEHIDFLLLQTAACSAGEQILPLAKCAPRIGLWATPEPEKSGDIKLHSFVSMSHFASILKRYLGHEHIPFKWFYGHVETDEFKERFRITIQALTAVKNIEKARIGWIGGLAPGFINMMFDEQKLRDNLGVSIYSHELIELVDRAKGYASEPVAQVVRDVRSVAAAITVTENSAFDRVARVYLAMRDMIYEFGYDALAVQCWPKFQSFYRVAPCLAYSWLGSEDGVAVSCEGDVLGAISMYLLNVITGNRGSSTLLDLAALDTEAGTALLWHCGVTPRHFADKNGIKWVDHTTLGRKQEGMHFGVAGDLVIAPQETTVAYVSEDGKTLLALGSNVVERQNKGFDGTRGWFANFELNQEPISLIDLINTLTVRGHEHHYAVGQGNVTRELMEFAAWKNMGLVNKIPYADYVQIEGVNV